MKTFNIALIAKSIKDTRIQYDAEDEKECKELFLANNVDLDETDFWIEEVKA